VTITTGAALAPDDDAAPDAEDGDDAQDSDGAQPTASTPGPAVSLVVTSEVVAGISLTIAPDVVSATPAPISADGDGNGDATLHVSTRGDSDAPVRGATTRRGTAAARVPTGREAAGAAASPDAVTDDESTPGWAEGDGAPEPDNPLLSVIALTTPETPPAPPRVPVGDRLRAALPFTGPGLTGLGGVVLGCLVVGLGTAGDLALGGGLGAGFAVTFVLACVLVAGALRTRALAIAIVLPPLLFAGGYALETKSSGKTTGRREMALDVATSLALHAPLLFIGTALAVALVLIRLVVHLIRR
jgi:hypothetical protein